MENVNDDMTNSDSITTNGKADIPVLEINTTPKSSSIEQDAVSQECVIISKISSNIGPVWYSNQRSIFHSK